MNRMPTVAVFHDLPIESVLRGRRDDLEVVAVRSNEDAYEALETADILVVNPANWDDSFVDHLEGGNWIQATSTGYDVFPLARLGERGVTLTNAAGNYAPVVSEHAFAMMLALSRNLPTLLDRQRKRIWDRSLGLHTTDWAGRTMTVLGLGTIGEAIARKGVGFDMAVYGVKRRPDEYGGCLPGDRVLSPEQLPAVLPVTDVLMVIVPLTDETRHLVNTKTFDQLPDTSMVINVARGPVIDEEALLAALDDGSIAAAGLDVFESEPLPAESRLWARDDVLVTPHVAGRSDRFAERFASLFLENYDRKVRGAQLRNVIVDSKS